jgi:hypothetical protein
MNPYPFMPLQTLPRACQGCGRLRLPGSGCRWCTELTQHWHGAQREHPELTREEAILVGSFVAGMTETHVREHGRGRKFTKAQFERALQLASRRFLEGISER